MSLRFFHRKPVSVSKPDRRLHGHGHVDLVCDWKPGKRSLNESAHKLGRGR